MPKATIVKKNGTYFRGLPVERIGHAIQHALGPEGAIGRPARRIAGRVGDLIQWESIPGHIQTFLESKEVGKCVAAWLERNVWKLGEHPEKRGISEAASRYLATLPAYFYMFTGAVLGDRRVPMQARFLSSIALTYLVMPSNLLLPRDWFGPYVCLDDLLVCSLTTRGLEKHVGNKRLSRLWIGDGDPVRHAREVYSFCEATLASLLFRKVERWINEA
jgi:uncharacterized membrane protein YkvA (DUF1232 family)